LAGWNSNNNKKLIVILEERSLGRVSKDRRKRSWIPFETPRKMRGSSG
jgi:hypothetical protein